MTKNTNSIIVGLLTIGFMALVIMNRDKDAFEQPMVLDENVIWIDFNENQMDIWMKNTEDIYGFQFEFDNAILNSTDGGILNREGFNNSHNERVFLSFSFDGKSIPAGEHMLISIDASFPNGKNNVKMDNMVLAGKNGKSMDFIYYDSIYKATTFRTNN